MPRRLVAEAGFLRAYRRLAETDAHRVDEALAQLRHYLATGDAAAGLGIKHLGGRTYECRAGLALRIVYVVVEAEVVLSLLGHHDEVRRFLKRQ
jgi:hypothetical protein